uniref:Uncharacterized protein n=1 Tax=Amphimedon queenslandica TaxID=400682 RepID=A0A1X7TZB2_AMPQE
MESLGYFNHESSLYEQFKRNVVFRDGRYEVPLPWKCPLQDISCNYQLYLKRLRSQLRRLQRAPRLLREYYGIIQGQLKNGMIEQVPEPEIEDHDKTHYLPHHAVI